MNRTIAHCQPSSGASGTVGGWGSTGETNLSTSKLGGARPIRVLLADDHPVVRWGLTCCLSPHEQMMVIGEAADGLETLRKARELLPDVVLMDIDMPGLNGLSVTETLQRESPQIKVLLLSMHPYVGHVERILKSGARGFLLKDTRPPDLIAAIIKVATGGTCFSPTIARQALTQFAQNRAGDPRSQSLTARERDVLVGIAEGLSNKAMATRLGISARTIETHRSHIMRKLNIHTVAGLTRYAVSHGLISMEKLKE
jgi:two-component system nitrate/nitrite response regulator NarL